MVSRALIPVVLISKGLCLEATRTWHIQLEFSDCRCDIVCTGTIITFSRRCAAEIESKQFSEFGSRTARDTMFA